MLDPKIQKKGGFGAFVGREEENEHVRAEALAHEHDVKPAVPPDGTPAKSDAPKA